AFYVGGFVLWILAGLTAGASVWFAAASIVPAAIMGWQIATLDVRAPGNTLRRFKANHWVGLALTASIFVGLV
ncbi:MAG: 4-hydroxybenzoate polyprenyltransferase, partial [Hyphomicrobiales bacterium]|nr:4-hydroxybenzoate polyprenyltransferase [Hyphomicrobiales bacterium]